MIGSAPSYINWNYTYACNFNCTHCYSRSPQYPRDLSTEKYIDIARQIVEQNVFAVGFGGGEPTIRKDLIEIISILSSGGVDTHLTSNGSLLDRKYLERLKKSGVGTLLISIDSHKRELNDRIRNNHAAFDSAINAARISVELGVRTLIASVATAVNYGEIEEIEGLASEIGADGVNIKIFRASGGAVQSRATYELNDAQKISLRQKIYNLKRNSKLSIETYQDADDSSCSCGRTQITLRPNGDLAMCPYSSHVIGNINHNTLQEIWLGSADIGQRRAGPSPCLSTASEAYPYNPAIPLSVKRK